MSSSGPQPSDAPEPDAPLPAEIDAARPPEGEAELARALGGTDAGRAANVALRSLARAARSSLIYDANNETIRGFLADYRGAMAAALQHGPMELEVRPFELVLGDDIVYVQRDRDKSLAFRLFRDGVRRLTLAPEVPWEELLRLLEILSIRYTGVRQHEDDIVTLLWKAGFGSIDVVSVEGFVLDGDEDEQADLDASSQRAGGPAIEVPHDWDHPLPDLPVGDPDKLAWVPVDPGVQAELRAEISSRAVAPLAVTLCGEMLALVSDPTDPTELRDVVGLVDEVRGLLLAEGQLDSLLDLARSVAALEGVPAEDIERELVRFTDPAAVRAVLHSAARSGAEVPPELDALLDLVPGDHLTVLVGLLGVERGRGSRRLARMLIARFVASRAEYVGELVVGSKPEVAADLLRAVTLADPGRSVALAERVLDRRDGVLQVEVRRVLERADAEALPAPALLRWLTAPDAETRAAVVGRLGALGGAGVYDALVRHLDGLPGSAHEEAGGIGLALAALDPDRAVEQLGDWVRPHKLWDRMRFAAHAGLRQWAGVSGLGALPGDYPVTAIRWLSERAGEDLHQHCQKTLRDRRRAGGGGRTGVLASGDALHHRGVLAHPGKLVLTGQMLCYEPTRALDRMAGARELDLPVCRIRSAEVAGLDRVLTVEVGEETFRFTGEGARAAHRVLAPMLHDRGDVEE